MRKKQTYWLWAAALALVLGFAACDNPVTGGNGSAGTGTGTGTGGKQPGTETGPQSTLDSRLAGVWKLNGETITISSTAARASAAGQVRASALGASALGSGALGTIEVTEETGPYNEFAGDIVYWNVFDLRNGVMIVKYHKGKENTYFSGGKPTGEFYGVYVSDMTGGVAGAKAKIFATSDVQNRYGPTETATLEEAVAKFTLENRDKYIMDAGTALTKIKDEAGSAELTWSLAKVDGKHCRRFYAIAYGDGNYVAVGWDGHIVSSTDGENWTHRNSPLGGTYLKKVAYGNGRFIAVGDQATMGYSIDGGKTWVKIKPADNKFPSGENIEGIAYGNGVWVAAGNAYGTVTYSNDNGATWTKAEDSTYNGVLGLPNNPDRRAYIYGLSFANDKFLIYGHGTAWSPDGETWTALGNRLKGFYFAVAYANGKYVSAGWYSEDGLEWIGEQANPIFGWNSTSCKDIAYGAGKFIGVGDWGIIGMTQDGKNWTALQEAHPSDVTVPNGIFGIVYDGRRFIRAGGEGVIAYSNDQE